MKIRLLAPLLCAALFTTATDALGLAGELKEPGVAFSQSYPDAARQQVMAALNRSDSKFLKGSFVNWHTTLFYAGETKALNLFLADLAKCSGVTLHVSFASDPIAGEPCDWVVSHDSEANRFAVRVNLKSDRIKLSDLSLPEVKGPALPDKTPGNAAKKPASPPTPAPTDVGAAREGLLKPGTPAPELPYMCLDDGRMASLAATHHGKIVVLEFWATWSGPCQQAMADLQKTAAKFAGQKDKIDFLTISIDGNNEEDATKIPAAIDKAVAHLKQKGWTQTLNGWSGFEELKEWKVRAVPTTYITSTDGKVISANPQQKLEDVIAGLLKK